MKGKIILVSTAESLGPSLQPDMSLTVPFTDPFIPTPVKWSPCLLPPTAAAATPPPSSLPCTLCPSCYNSPWKPVLSQKTSTPLPIRQPPPLLAKPTFEQLLRTIRSETVQPM